MTEICGFLDDSGKFWKTQEEAQIANDTIERNKLVAKVYKLLEIDDHKPYYWYSGDRFDLNVVANRMVNNPEKFLTIL